MSETSPKTLPASQFTTRTLFLLTGLIAISLVPCVYLGWLGIPISILIVVCGVLMQRKRYSLLVGFVIVVSLLVLLLDPGFYIGAFTGPPSRNRAHCMNNMRQIALAILTYESMNGHFPPPYTTDEDGKPLHSWRVLILPYMDEQQLYDQIDLTKPWDHPTNLALADQMPRVYWCPNFDPKASLQELTTAYVAVIGDHTVWPRSGKRKFQDIVDGYSKTLLVVESEKHRIHWMSTADPDIESGGSSDAKDQWFQTEGLHPGVYSVVFVDASVHLLPQDMDLDDFLSLLTIDGGETVEDW